jgi:hypothetical protein
MFLPHFPTDRVTVLSGPPPVLNAFHHELLIDALESGPKPVIFLDGAHCLNAYDLPEHNVLRGREPDAGVERVLLCRAMTPFQWSKMLTTELHDHLQLHEPNLVIAAHFDLQFNKDDLVDWEQEDYVGASVRYIRRLAHLHKVPIVLTLDFARWTKTHRPAASILERAGLPFRHVSWDPRGFSLADERGNPLVQPQGRLVTLDGWSMPIENEAELLAVADLSDTSPRASG